MLIELRDEALREESPRRTFSQYLIENGEKLLPYEWENCECLRAGEERDRNCRFPQNLVKVCFPCLVLRKRQTLFMTWRLAIPMPKCQRFPVSFLNR